MTKPRDEAKPSLNPVHAGKPSSARPTPRRKVRELGVSESQRRWRESFASRHHIPMPPEPEARVVRIEDV